MQFTICKVGIYKQVSMSHFGTEIDFGLLDLEELRSLATVFISAAENCLYGDMGLLEFIGDEP